MTYNYNEIEKTLLRHINFKAMGDMTCNQENYIDFMDYDEIDLHWHISSGATKCVFIPKDIEKMYVIKVPFNADVDWNYDEDDFFRFYNAVYPLSRSRGWDYCKSEVEYFELAAQAGLDDYFAETMSFGYYDDYPIYIQERCEYAGPRPGQKFFDMVKECMDRPGYYYILTREFCANLLQQYSVRQVEELLDFIVNEGIGDLSCHNCGFSVMYENRPVIVDYSGYWE